MKIKRKIRVQKIRDIKKERKLYNIGERKKKV